jgi:predicted O-methyltransferase YrrM
LYSRFQIAKKYLHYFLTAASGKGYGIHSPFVFDFVSKVLNDRQDFKAYHQIEDLRRELLKNKTLVDIQDFGAGTISGKPGHRSIADITRRSAKGKKMGQLLFRLAHYYQPKIILEFGTSLGLSSAYLAAARPSARMVTLEGDGKLALQAKKNFEKLGLTHIEIVTGNFDDQLSSIRHQLSQVDLVFLDGNHLLQPTLNYFHYLLEMTGSPSLIIIDDIHWSRDMEEAWKKIKENSQVMMTIDLFFMGLVFFNESFKIKQNFTIRF